MRQRIELTVTNDPKSLYISHRRLFLKEGLELKVLSKLSKALNTQTTIKPENLPGER